MSKKVNIMADIDQTVYDAVVVPHKRNRSFTSLIEILLNGYYSNAYIRSFVDDAIDGIQHESNDILNDIISDMHQGLASMGVYTEEMKANAQDGINAFSKKSEEVKGELSEIQSKEIKDIKDGMDELREQVIHQNEEIMNLLKTIMAGSVQSPMMVQGVPLYTNPIPVEVPKESAKEELVEEDEVIDLLTEGNDSPLVNAAEVASEEFLSDSDSIIVDDSNDEDVTDDNNGTSEEEANNIMADLLLGQMYAY